MATFIHDGKAIDYTPGADVASGEVVVLGDVCFVAKRPITANTLGAIDAIGVFDIDKTAALEIALGDAVYFSTSTKKATKTTTDKYFGVCVKAAGASDATVRVFLRSLQEVVTGQLGLGDLSDVGSSTATAGNLLIGDGTDFESGKLTSASLADSADAAVGLPVLIRKACVNSAGQAADITVLASAPRKLLVVDAWLIARDTAAANVTLHKGTYTTDNFTDTKAKGTTADAIVAFGKVIAAKATIAAADPIKAQFSADGAADVFVLAVPVA